MKKHNLYTTFILLPAIALSGCFNDFSIPQKVSIKTDAEYNFTIAELDKDFSDSFSPDTILSGFSGGLFSIYDYNPNENQARQQFLMKMPIQEIPLDFGSYLEDSNFGADIGAMSFSQDVTIPSININNDQTIDISMIQAIINSDVIFIGPSILSGSKQKITFASGFSSVSYKNGTVVVTSETSGRSLKGTVVLYSGGEEIARTECLNGVARLRVDGKTIVAANTYIQFQDVGNNGIAFKGIIDPASQISIAKGVTAEQTVPTITQTLPVSCDDSIEECTFGADSKLYLRILTPGWTGCNFKRNISLSGGLDLPSSSYDPPTESFDLSSKNLNKQDIKVTLDLVISLENATIDFNKPPKLSVATDIPSIASVKIKLPSGVKTDISMDQELPAESAKMIKKIVWEEGTGIRVKYTNTFPAGNDFQLQNVKSSFMGLTTASSKTIEAGKSETLEFLTDAETETDIVFGPPNTKIDFTAALGLPGGEAGKIKVSNVEPGKTYKIDIEIIPELNWKELVIDSSSLTGINNKIKLSFNLNEIFSGLDSMFGTTFVQDLSFKRAPFMLFCEIPAIKDFKNPSFAGKITAYAMSGDSKITGSEVTLLDGVMPVSKTPVLRTNEKGTVINVIDGGKKQDISDITNALIRNSNRSVGIEYALNLSTGSSNNELSITREYLKGIENATINITAFFILPMEFSLARNQSIDVMQLAGMDNSTSDLLGRTEATDTSSMEEYLKAIQDVSLIHTPSKKPFISSSGINLKLDMDGPGGSNFGEKVISLNGGAYTEEPLKFLQCYPITPTVKLELLAGDFAIPREMAFKTRLDVRIKCSGKPVAIFGG